jgi:hypothetical protein
MPVRAELFRIVLLHGIEVENARPTAEQGYALLVYLS